MIFEGFWFQFSSQNAHKTKKGGFKMVGRAQRASAASDVSGALEKQAKRPPNTKKNYKNEKENKIKRKGLQKHIQIQTNRQTHYEKLFEEGNDSLPTRKCESASTRKTGSVNYVVSNSVSSTLRQKVDLKPQDRNLICTPEQNGQSCHANKTVCVE